MVHLGENMKHDEMKRREFMEQLGKRVAALSALPLLKNAEAFEESKESKELFAREQTNSPMNVIFVLSDDHRYDFMGFMPGREFLNTPNMNTLAKNGIHFQNAFVTTSLCSPSRASILTGMYAHKHGIVDNASSVRNDLTFFPEYLQKAGYETAFIGKWHMGENAGDDNPRPGFDRWISFRGQGEYRNPLLNIDGKHVKREGYITDILTEYALEFMNKDRDRPFFLYLSHKAVHAMFEPSAKYAGHYDALKIPYPARMADTEENYRDKPRWVKEQRNSWHGVDFMYHGAIDFDTFYRRYCETLLSLDDSLGTILDFTRRKGIASSTVIVYTSDNGFCLGEHGLIDKRHMYEESMRIPFLVYSPGNYPSGRKETRMIRNIDIAPTILDIAGIRKPASMDGQSFLPLLQGKDVDWIKEVFYEYFWEKAFPQTPTTFGVRTDEHKYIFYHGVWDIEELYNLELDPREMRNLFPSGQHQELVKTLKGRLFDWLERTGGMQVPFKRPTYTLDKRRPE
jgi:N-acetylglucosamine-6-sulfatase